MDDDRKKGHAKDVKGSAKETWGDVTRNKDIERSGQVDQAKGKVQKGFGEAKGAIRGKG